MRMGHRVRRTPVLSRRVLSVPGPAVYWNGFTASTM
jgi:hypothetical protein